MEIELGEYEVLEDMLIDGLNRAGYEIVPLYFRFRALNEVCKREKGG